MLWWAAGIGVPIAIHLLSRRRFRRVPWAAMELLERAFKKTRKRLRMENLLLLLLRILAILLIALALADPRWERSQFFGSGPESKVAVLVLDTSFSMDARDPSDRSAFSRAQDAANRVLQALDAESDASAFVTAGSPAQLVLPVTRELERVESALAATRQSASATDLLGALKIASALLADPALERDYPGARTVYVVTDLQKQPFLAPKARVQSEGEFEVAPDAPDPGFEKALRELEEARSRVVFVDLGELSDERRRNVAVTALDHVGRTLIRGVPTRFECRLRNFGSLDAGGEVEFYIDQEDTFARSERVENLRGEETGTEEEAELAFTFDASFERAGWHYVAVRYRDDDLKIDNLRRFAFEVRNHIRVLAAAPRPRDAEDQPASFFVARSLDPYGGARPETPFRVKEVDERGFSGERLADYDLVVLADISELSASRIRDLEEFVSKGGALLYFPGPGVETAGRIGENGGLTNEIFFRDGEGLLPGRLTRTRGSDEFTTTPFELQFETFDHPATRYFEDPRIRPGITRMPVHKFVEFKVPEDDDSVRVLASFRQANEEGSGLTSPAIIEHRMGDGRVIAFATSADRRWNLYGASPAFVPLMREFAYHLTQRPDRSNLMVGQTLIERFDPSVREVRMQRGDEPAQTRNPSLAPDKTSAELVMPRLDRAELVRLSYEGAPGQERAEKLIAINVDPSESDLERASDGWLTMHFGNELLEVVRDLDQIEEQVAEGGRSSLWRNLLWILLGALVLESLLARRIDARKTVGEAA